MKNIISFVPVIILPLILTACGGGGDSSFSSNKTKNTEPPKNVQGYYEAIVKADNGDDILLTMLVKPDGEYFGNFNNYIGNSISFNQEVFSIYSGNFVTNDDNSLSTRVTEFDGADKSSLIRKYNATATYTPMANLDFDLTKSNSKVDHKIYKLKYINFDGLGLNQFTSGGYNTVAQLGFNEAFAHMVIYDTENAKTKRVTVEPFENCFFEGIITDNNYDVKFYDFSGSYEGDGCPSNSVGKYNGVVYALNNTFIMMGTNQDKNTEMRVLKPGFKN